MGLEKLKTMKTCQTGGTDGIRTKSPAHSAVESSPQWEMGRDSMVPHGCETWSLTLRVFANRVLRRILGPSWDEVTGGWGEMHNEEHRNLHSSPITIRMMKLMTGWIGHAARMGRAMHMQFLWKSEETRSLVNHRRRRQLIIKWISVRRAE
jgi:hypothetical protein